MDAPLSRGRAAPPGRRRARQRAPRRRGCVRAATSSSGSRTSARIPSPSSRAIGQVGERSTSRSELNSPLSTPGARSPPRTTRGSARRGRPRAGAARVAHRAQPELDPEHPVALLRRRAAAGTRRSPGRARGSRPRPRARSAKRSSPAVSNEWIERLARAAPRGSRSSGGRARSRRRPGSRPGRCARRRSRRRRSGRRRPRGSARGRLRPASLVAGTAGRQRPDAPLPV